MAEHKHESRPQVPSGSHPGGSEKMRVGSSHKAGCSWPVHNHHDHSKVRG